MLAFFPFIHPPREQQCDVLWELCAGARLTVIETTDTEKYVDLTFLLPEARMTQLQHGWGESMLIKKKITLIIKLMPTDSDFLHVSL